jgi:tetratricopeptide (TPR) repeat protein
MLILTLVARGCSMSARRRQPKELGESNPPVTARRKRVESAPPRPLPSRRRKWLFRLAVAVLSPMVFLAVLEAGLRLGGYGYPTCFLIGPDAKGVYTSNPNFARRFFPAALARKPEACFLSGKPAGTVRIFLLGSSAAQGVPDPSFGVGRILEVMLRERHPALKFEVVNAAMTAINSHVARQIARDCAAHQPDLFVVYMGNNEVVGPYGPGTVFQQWSPSLTFIRANAGLKATRVGQLLAEATGWLGCHKASPSEWRGMEMFLDNPVTADDPRLPAVYENFRQNLRDICAVAHRAGAGVILSTVAVNLQDCPPFASLHRSGLSPEESAKWDSLYQAGIAAEKKGRHLEAIAKYEEAARIDNRFAELRYRLGRCLAGLNRHKEAREQFASARDLDVLRFRADSRINATIREVAVEQKAAGAHLVDAEQSVASSELASGDMPGANLFYEHVHFTFDGNCLLATAMLSEVEAALPQLSASSDETPVPSRDRCAELLVLTPWDEYEMAEVMTNMTSRPPFTAQLGHAARQALAEKQAAELGSFARTPRAIETAVAAYEAALEKMPSEWQFHYRFGKVAMACGQYKLAAEHLRAVQRQIPWEASVCNLLGEAVQGCGRPDEAIALFQKAVQIDPGFAEGHSNLGVLLANSGRRDEAIGEYRRALEIDPQFAMAYYNLGIVLGNCKQIDEAIDQYQHALKIDPRLTLAHCNLANLLSERGRFDEAVAHLEKALEIDPRSILARTILGNLFRSRGRLDEAITQFQKAVDIEPRSATLHWNLAIALNERGRSEEAVAQYQEVLRIDPRSAVAHRNLGDILHAHGKFEEAIVHFQKALELRPDFPEARAGLKKATKARQQLSAKP